VSVVAASALGATVTVEVPGIEAESVAINGAQYLKLTIPGAVSAVLDVGKPEVPAVPVLLARPTGSTVTLTILSIKTETLDVARVYPMQRPLKYGEQAGPLTVDNSFYASDVEYPSGRLSSPRTATWRDLDVVNVHVYPVAVRPAQHQVIVTSRIKFRVDFSGGHYPARVTGWMVPMYRRLVQNYDGLRFTTAEQEPPGTKCLVFCDSAYYNDDYKNPALDSLLKLMTKLGDSTEVINVPDSVQAVPESIKTTIRNRYGSQHPSALHWVLLVGNHIQIPPKSDIHNTPYSDYWYSDWGQGYDTCDGYPEVGIARLSPDSNADLSHQIEKIRAYMLGTDTGDWLNRMTLVAHFDDSADHYVRHARAFAHDTARFFSRDSIDTIFGGDTPSPTNSDIQLSVERGTGVLIYLGHGEYDRWWCWNHDTTGWRVNEVDDLENPHTPVVFNLACWCGDPRSGTCLSKKWMSKYDSESSKGAVASFGAYGEVWIVPTDEQCMVAVKAIGDYDTLYHELNEYAAPVFDLGGIQMLMVADVTKNWPKDTTDRYFSHNKYSFYWLGNPAMPVWSGGVPQTATVTHPSWIPTGPQDCTVTVSIGGLGVENAQVCVYKPDDFYAVGLTDSSGNVTLSLTANDTGSFFVSASKGHVGLSDTNALQHTPMLPHFDTAFVCNPDSVMTYPNWGRKLVRDPGNASKLNVVYTARDSVFYTQSTDGGTNWPIDEPIGAGTSPAIVLNGAGPAPWVVYLTPDSSICRAIRSNQGVWDDTIIFQGTAARAGAPALAVPAISEYLNPMAYVTYPAHDTSTGDNFVYFKTFTPSYVSPPELVDAAGSTPCYGASIAVTPLSRIHVAWARGESIYYRQRDTAWSAPTRISRSSWPPTEPASNPSVEAYGDSVFCVWRGPNDSAEFPGDIWRRSRYLSWQPSVWADPSNQSKSESLESDYPVMTTSFATVWQEQVSPDSTSTDIWGKFLGDPVPYPFFQTQLQSLYPHVDGYWIGMPGYGTFRCNTVWTEQQPASPPQYALGCGVREWTLPSLGKGLGPDPRKDYEPASYYAAELGQPKPSPYCLSRGGFAQFESWNTDTSATGLTYQLPYLDPRRVYKLRAVLYHEGEGTWKADLRCDSGPWFQVKANPRVPDTVWIQVPRRYYKDDARIVVELARVTGGYVSLARLKLFQIEPEPDGREGVQSTSGMLRTRLLNCAPNPFSRMAAARYELGQAGPVELTVRDVSGRLVRRLVSGYRSAGRYDVGWNATDDRDEECRRASTSCGSTQMVKHLPAA
jgi:hypothetical protein